jgi:hypothetical protein
MPVPMMRVGEVCMHMSQRLVPVRVSVPSPPGDGRIMLIRVVRIVAMHMFVLVFERFVHMFMLVPFREMEPHAERHQCSSSQQLR